MNELLAKISIILRIIATILFLSIMPKQWREIMDNGRLKNLKILLFSLSVATVISTTITLIFTFSRIYGFAWFNLDQMAVINGLSQFLIALMLTLIYFKKY